ncbi:hypothetical protein VT84_05945 [Gemmata sp. SH-PL17]|uniref:hypothetical protein n=1 Tax=Gemmata sp. SH-PL17 TaxID=1630693 RepID=UPI00078B4989|nr:hypothetical protein [Gemmata sp. SH-PL17]AMV23917.1 hypothetical protein VT84_05945 [Gemmata sp. SH-PL17]
MTGAWEWNRSGDALVAHRLASPWDDQERRSSHTDKHRARQRELLAEEINAVVVIAKDVAELRELAERLLNLAI